MRTISNARITLSDGCRLAARIWLPDDAEANPVPAILEYLPYRKDDANASQDLTRFPYFAEHGYAGVRVDIRGSGSSEGLIEGEYTVREQLDALEVIAWLAEQPWCDGGVGMIGYSWGGFNGLQIAARRPPALKAIVTMHAADDRYADDCHYQGGCLLGSDMLKWATSMRAYDALPPDPRWRDDWRSDWLRRLAETPAFIGDWLAHQRYDEFWKQGSVCEDYSAIEAATLVVGGWADSYTNAVPRLLEHLSCERRGIIGPWAHMMPYRGVPGPAIDFLTEVLRWYDRWLKGLDTGVEDDPMLRVWLQHSVEPATWYAERPGRWVAEAAWPPPSVDVRSWPLADATRSGAGVGHDGVVALTGSQACGETAGVWCSSGNRDELPGDQRADDARSACFDFAPAGEALELLGRPVARLRLRADRERALVAVRLCEARADGSSLLLAWNQLNLTHRDGHEVVRPVVPGEAMEVAVELSVLGHVVAPDSVLRVAISPTYWPHAWPSPEAVTLELDVAGCSIELPVREAGERASDRVEPFAEIAPAGMATAREHRREVFSADGLHRIVDRDDRSSTIADSGTVYRFATVDEYEIAEGDPLSARAIAVRESSLNREGFEVAIRCDAELTADAATFFVTDRLRAWEGGELVFDSEQRFEIERDGV